MQPMMLDPHQKKEELYYDSRQLAFPSVFADYAERWPFAHHPRFAHFHQHVNPEVGSDWSSNHPTKTQVVLILASLFRVNYPTFPAQEIQIVTLSDCQTFTISEAIRRHSICRDVLKDVRIVNMSNFKVTFFYYFELNFFLPRIFFYILGRREWLYDFGLEQRCC